MFFETEIGKAFGVELIRSAEMDSAVQKWDSVSTGLPPWLNADDGIETVNMAKHISDTRAKLISLDLGIKLSGGARAAYLQEVVDDLLDRLPEKLTDAARLGGMVLKWNTNSWDFVMPGDFGITKLDGNGEIVGAIFAEHIMHGDRHYTRLEYHRFEDDLYVVTNKAFVDHTGSGGKLMLGREIPLTSVDEWQGMEPETSISGLEKPLFAYFRMPGANTIDQASPLGVSVFANAMAELKAIDIAISRKNAEVEDSKHITFVGQMAVRTAQKQGISLPRFIQGIGMGLSDGEVTAIKEHVPTMLIDARIKDINFDLSMAGVKCGFSEGVFVMDGQTGMVTATQVEADDRDTILTIKNDRDALQTAIEQAVYGADALATLMGLAPQGDYEMEFNFGDITYNYEEDKANWKSYVLQGWIPAWKYLVKFEKMSEEEARALTQEMASTSASSAVDRILSEIE